MTLEVNVPNLTHLMLENLLRAWLYLILAFFWYAPL